MEKRYQCANCDFETDDNENLLPISDLNERIGSDDLHGIGDCPKCGAMAFDTLGHQYQMIRAYSPLRKALGECHDFIVTLLDSREANVYDLLLNFGEDVKDRAFDAFKASELKDPV